MIVIAAHRALQDAGVAELSGIPVVAATAIGETQATIGILTQIHQTAGMRISPALVPNSVHNAAAGYLLIATKNRAPSITVSQGWLSGEAALVTAQDLLAAGRASRVLVVAGDEADPTWVDRLRRLEAPELADALSSASFQEGATAWLLENRANPAVPYLKAAVERVPLSADSLRAVWDRHGITPTKSTEVRLRKNGGGALLRDRVAAALGRDADSVCLDGVGAGTVQSAPLLSVAQHVRDGRTADLLLLAYEAEELGMVWFGRT